MRKLVIAVLVVLGLAVAADFGAAAFAEYTVAKNLKERLGLATEPSVQIEGFPFLTQALAGHYSAIDMNAAGLSVGPLHDVEAEATLHDVDAPLSEVTAGNLQSVQAARVDGRIRVKDSDLGRAIGIEDLRVQPPSDNEIKAVLPAGGSTSGSRAPVRMMATTDVAGQRIEIIGIGMIELNGSALRITVVDVRLAHGDGGEVTLPREIRQVLLKALSTEVQPGQLPFTVTPTRVSVETGSLVVEGTAQHVSMAQAGVSAR
ncbi:MAG TPA: DUF2993 domain-containing protein [Pseudonocardiaceae bacterium]